MKKFFSVLVLVGMVVFVTAQTTATNTSGKEVSKFSVALKAGLTYDLVNPQGAVLSSLGTLLPGVSLEYNFNPVFGLGADLSMLSYKRTIDQGNTMDVTAFSTFNLSNLFSPVRTGFWKKMSFYANMGGGFGWYSYTTNTATTVDAVSPLMVYGALAEYSLSKNLALGLEGQYRFYMDFKENVGVAPINGLGVDGAVAAISLRYKFTGKDKKHVRDMDMEDYYPSPIKQLAQLMKEENAALQRQIDALKGDNDAVRQRVNKLESDMTGLKDDVRKNKQSMEKLVAEVTTPNFDLPAVLFEFQTNKMVEGSAAIIDNVVDVLKNNVFNKLVLAGHADSIGPDDYNQTLGLQRANAVKEVLTSKGIPAAKIETVSFGETKPVAPNTTPEGRQKNRRVELNVNR